jgi:hypothetical protein
MWALIFQCPGRLSLAKLVRKNMAFDYSQSETYPGATRIELIEAANRGLGGQGALVESMFRLMDSIGEQERSTNRLNKMLLWFTIAIFVLTGAILV